MFLKNIPKIECLSSQLNDIFEKEFKKKQTLETICKYALSPVFKTLKF